uniref:Angiomotin C-terminal domain-containing protein n=1 Tax=Timema tahoe TaxID=61484 RepID=A0A7R9IBG2_9NEOP|nr:unnamed protein product [Timema tahoe]
MSSLQQTSRFIPFTNSAQRAQLMPNQGGFPQSLSGSETDVSTSNENLSNEERYVIQHTARQEPQGQENLSSNRSSLDVSSSSYNTLIIHGAGDEPWTGRLSGIRDHQDSPASTYFNSHCYNGSPVADIVKAKMGSHSPSPSMGGGKDHNSLDSNNTMGCLYDPSVREITDIPDDYLNQSQVLKHLAKEVKVVPSSGNNSGRESVVPRTEDDNSELDQLKRLSRKKKKATTSCLDHHDPIIPSLDNDLPPPPDYPKWLDTPLNRLKLGAATEKLNLSRSQPDLSRIGAGKQDLGAVTSPRPKTNGREDKESRSAKEVWPPAEMVEILIQENSSLKQELETCYQKVAKSQKLEQEISKIHRAHEELVQSSERRERLERTARMRLQEDCRRLQEVNRALREQVELLSTQVLTARPQSDLSTDNNLRRELNKREVLIAQLITQNKELVAAKERQEIELTAQRATLQEQRTHIDILDTALTNAQGNVVRLEEECRKKQVYVERVGQLQRALSSLQQASDRREQTERKLRLQLEHELRNERARAGGGCGDEGGGSRGGLGSSSQGAGQGQESGPELKRLLREREEKVMRLEGEVTKWEQRYLEESALRQAAIDAASIPKDAKIAALEKTSQETERLIAEARSEKIRHMDEVHAAQKKLTDLESKTKELESKLAEKDAMIRVLQKHTYDKDVSSSSSSYPSMLGCSPHPSIHGNSDLGAVLGTSVSREELDPVSTTGVFSTVSSVLTSSCSTGISSYAGSDSPTSKLSSYHASFGSPARSKYGSVAGNKSFDDTKKSLDDQLKELDSKLDSQLLTKTKHIKTCFGGRMVYGVTLVSDETADDREFGRGLCCFPGFSNTGTSPRKGKIPKPLLASVGGVVGEHLFEPGWLVPARYEQGRPEEIMLLEKQGRSSQQQRMQETCISGEVYPPLLVPCPAPGGSTSSQGEAAGVGRKGNLGEYGRLSDGEGRKTPASEVGEGVRVRSNIPPPRKLGEYGRLSDGEGRSLRKPSPVGRSAGTRDSATSGSEDSASQTKLRLFPGPRSRRGSSLTRDAKPASTDSSVSGKSVASTGTVLKQEAIN